MHTNKKRLPGGRLYEKLRKAEEGIAKSVEGKTLGLMHKAGMTNEATPENIRKYSKELAAVVKAAQFDPTGRALPRIRRQVLADMPKDFTEYFTGVQRIPSIEGIPTRAQVHDLYWGVPEFVMIWGKLGFSEDMLDNLIIESARAGAIKSLPDGEAHE